MSHPRKIARLVRAGALGIFVVFLFAIVLTQIEQHLLRRRAENLLADVRSLEIHRATLSDVQKLKRKWGHLAHYEGNCTEHACTLEILWNDFYFRNADLFSRFDVLHFFLLAGARPEQIKARVTVDNGVASGKGFYVVVEAIGDWAQGRWWDYPLMGNAYSLSSFEGNYRPPANHPNYIVGRPGGCDGPCREVHFIFSPSADSATVNRLMQIDLSCLTRWIHPCHTEGDIMPSAWAQYELDYGRTIN